MNARWDYPNAICLQDVPTRLDLSYVPAYLDLVEVDSTAQVRIVGQLLLPGAVSYCVEFDD